MSNKKTKKASQSPVIAQAQLVIASSIVLAAVLLLAYALAHASETALRWWAGLITAVILPIALTSYWLGHTEARGRIAGLDLGINAVTKAAVNTTDAAGRTANIRVQAARQVAAPPTTPSVQQVFLPPSVQRFAGHGVILPPQQADGEVEA